MSILSQRIFLWTALVLLLVLAACQASPAANQRSSTADQSYPPITLHDEADRYEFNTPERMCSALLVAEVTHITHGKSRWNTPDGLRPHISAVAPHASIAQTIVEQGYRIYTPVQFGMMKIFKDHRQQETEAFMTLGGQVQQDQYWLDPFPQLRDGDHYVIVFSPTIQPGQGKVETWLLVYNAFPVDAQGIVTLQQAGSPNEPGPGKPQPAVTISLSNLQQQLAGCRSAN